MKKHMILIVDKDRNFVRELSEYISKEKNFDVATAYDGEEAYSLLCEKHPDAVIMDVILPKLDGMSFLRKAKGARLAKSPVIIVCSSLATSHSIDTAVSLGADYYLEKPQTYESIFAAVSLLLPTPQSNLAEKSPKQDLEKLVTNFIQRIGIPANIKGYRYVRTALMMAAENMDVLELITKNLYPTVAGIYHTKISNVERALRHAVEVVWSRGNPEILYDYFECDFNPEKRRPTNSEFIAMAADCIRLQMR